MGQRTAQWPIIPVAVLLTAMLSIQGGASLAKHLFPNVGAQGATALRLGFAALMMLAVWRPWRTPIAFDGRRQILVYGVALGAMNLLFYLAIRSVPLGVAVALEFLGPLAVALFGSRRAADLIWVVLALIGIVLLMSTQLGVRPIDPLGIVLAMGAGGCWALYIVSGKKAAFYGRGPAVAYGTVVAAALAVPIGIAHAGERLLSMDVVPLALAVAILTSAIPYSLEMVALDRLPTRVFGILTSLEPALASVSGFVFLGEHLSALQMVGVGTITAASVGVIAANSAASPAPA